METRAPLHYPYPGMIGSHPSQPVYTYSNFQRYERSLPSDPRSDPAFKQEQATNFEPVSGDIILSVRQQPKEALQAADGKEKGRKPVDPPPVVQLKVRPSADPAELYMQSPYLFMCTTLYKADVNEPLAKNGSNVLLGCLASSLHRLKDVDNQDTAFFIWGDISVKIAGEFRLHFSLFNLHKDTKEVQYLASITSEKFRVVPPRDWKGMQESTYLSRAFSDQGCRLRLRKEPKGGGIGNKRKNPYDDEYRSSNFLLQTNMQPDPNPYLGMVPIPPKRRRSSEAPPNAAYMETLGVAGPPLPAGYSAPQYALYQPSTSNTFTSPGQYSSYRPPNADQAHQAQAYQHRFGSGQIRNDFGPALDTGLSPTSGTMQGFRYAQTPLQTTNRTYPSFQPQTGSSPPLGGPSAMSSYPARPTASLGEESPLAGPSSTSQPRSMAHQILERHVQPLGASQQPQASILGTAAGLNYPSSVPRTNILADSLGLSLQQPPEQNALPTQYQSQSRIASDSELYSGSIERGPTSAWALQNQD